MLATSRTRNTQQWSVCLGPKERCKLKLAARLDSYRPQTPEKVKPLVAHINSAYVSHNNIFFIALKHILIKSLTCHYLKDLEIPFEGRK